MTVRLFSFRKGAANLMDGYETEKLDALYARIERESRAALLRGGRADAFLRHPEADTRMSVVLLFRPTDEITARVGGMLRDFQTRFPALYSYPASDMHVTVLARPPRPAKAGGRNGRRLHTEHSPRTVRVRPLPRLLPRRHGQRRRAARPRLSRGNADASPASASGGASQRRPVPAGALRNDFLPHHGHPLPCPARRTAGLSGTGGAVSAYGVRRLHRPRAGMELPRLV